MCTRLIRKRVCIALWSEAGHAFCAMFITKWLRFVLWSRIAFKFEQCCSETGYFLLYGVN